jgi:hypothetical protein
MPTATAASARVADPALIPDSAAPDALALPREIGPYEIPFLGKRTVYFVVPPSRTTPQRLIANLHGICNPPGYACGYWTTAASEFGFLACPTGNAACGGGPNAPPSWDEPIAKIEEDLELSIKVLQDSYPGEIERDGAVLTGFSKGAYTAVTLASRHPGRWPYLILNEANVSLSLSALESAQVRAVALVAGEWGTQLAGERKTYEALKKQGYPINLWVMPKAGHYYSANIDEIMRQALSFVLSHEHDG